MSQLYGRGVHAYFANDYLTAHARLTAVIQNNTRDPRAYYFRGLAYLEMNREEQARLDFQKAGELEAADSNVFYDVSKALVRIQGRPRTMIEEYRMTARTAAMQSRRSGSQGPV